MLERDIKGLTSAIGRAIARQRMQIGLTQEEVAERLGIGSEAISRIERGVVMPSIPRLIEFAALFDCATTELLTEASPHPNDQAERVSRLLATLEPTDRQFILEWTERLAEKLRHSKD
ncbi:MAG: helix-turn-helix domain-containing protein [Burkholderiales bacterium]|jgi:transcriptional regulator with XRE-family HTH domain|nr:helix-turn-helix domain-containing protein [Burkholderiales bacterium]